MQGAVEDQSSDRYCRCGGTTHCKLTEKATINASEVNTLLAIVQ